MTERRVRIALAVSVFLNVFAVGTVAGGLLLVSRGDEGGLIRSIARGRPIRAAGQELPAVERARFQEAMRQAQQEGRPLARRAREARRDAALLFLAPQFDQAAAAAALDRARAADMALRARLEGAALDFAASLTPGDRGLLASGLERRGPLRGTRIP